MHHLELGPGSPLTSGLAGEDLLAFTAGSRSFAISRSSGEMPGVGGMKAG